MPIFAEAARNALLDTTVGPAVRPAAIPANFYLALFHTDPSTVGDPPSEAELELAFGAYNRITVPNNTATWTTASGGIKSTKVALAFPESADGGWSDTATHAGLFDNTAANSGQLWDWTALASPITVTGAGITVSFPIGAITIRQL